MQLSLFGKRPLFDDGVLSRRRSEWAHEPLPAFEENARSMRDFSRSLFATTGRRKETALEQEFNRALFVTLFGYQLYPGVEGAWTAWPKPPIAATGLEGEPDLVLGHFRNDEPLEVLAVVELKSPGTSFDSPQPSYRNRTPVEQAFDYADGLPSCRWVIVSDMRFLRLYSIDTQDEFHELELQPIASGTRGQDTLHEAYRLLAYSNLVAGSVDSATARLLSAARGQRDYFRDGFYGIYAEIRATLLSTLQAALGDTYSRPEQVLAVQRLLDRLLFIFFGNYQVDVVRFGL